MERRHRNLGRILCILPGRFFAEHRFTCSVCRRKGQNATDAEHRKCVSGLDFAARNTNSISYEVGEKHMDFEHRVEDLWAECRATENQTT